MSLFTSARNAPTKRDLDSISGRRIERCTAEGKDLSAAVSRRFPCRIRGGRPVDAKRPSIGLPFAVAISIVCSVATPRLAATALSGGETTVGPRLSTAELLRMVDHAADDRVVDVSWAQSAVAVTFGSGRRVEAALPRS